jgi:hypothetical protein
MPHISEALDTAVAEIRKYDFKPVIGEIYEE